MSPNKSKRGSEDSPEEKKSKKKKTSDENEDEEEREGAGSISKMSKIPAHLSSSQKPAELFRKDLISAMKLPDSESLAQEEYLLIADSWRQEWERGVQVPVNEVGIPDVDLREVHEVDKTTGDFKMPKKLLHSNKDETYRQGCHELTGMSQLAEQVVRYDLDDLDVCWLRRVNEEREEIGETLIYEWTVERVIEALETKCHENMEIKKKTEEGLGIEYDEDIVCEICRSPDSEDSNEMVFCDGCDICVHQACYGISTVPQGDWLCRSCALGIKPSCILCPNPGGAMKSTRSGTKWAHVSCAIWIPEVTIGCVEKMEPITKISEIPASRWALVCTVCKERTGACIQCSVKACKTAFHVTCGFSSNLEMRTILVEEGDDDEAVKLKAYCPKHSKKRDSNASESEPDSPRKSVCGTPKKEMTEEEKATLRAERLQRLEEEFYTVINVHDLATSLELDQQVTDLIYVYWKLKRKALFNRPLLTPKTEEADLLEKQQEDSLVARMKMFVHLRQDLERVRNLSYMISRREKTKRSFNKARENVFYGALAMLTDTSLKITEKDVQDVVKQYKDLPSQRVSTQKSGKVKTDLMDFESESDSGFSRKGKIKGLSSKNRKSLTYESDSDAVSVSSAKSSISPESAGSARRKRPRKLLRKSDTPGPKLKLEDSKVGGEGDDINTDDIKTKVEKMEIDMNNSTDMNTSMSTSVDLDSSINKSTDMDTSEIIDIVSTDDTLVKSDIDTSKDDTVVKSELDTSVVSVSSEGKEEKDSDEKELSTPGRVKRKAGRPPKRKSNKDTEASVKLEAKVSQGTELNITKTEAEKREKEKAEVPVVKHKRTRSNILSEIVSDKKLEEPKASVTETHKRRRMSKSQAMQKDDSNEKATDKKLDEEKLSVNEAGKRKSVSKSQSSEKLNINESEPDRNPEEAESKPESLITLVLSEIVSDKKEEETAHVEDKPKRSVGSKSKSSLKLVPQDSKAKIGKDNKVEKDVEASVKPIESRSLFDTIQKDLIESLPSAKHVSKDIKAELSGYFRNNKLIVSDTIKEKVQSSLLKCRRNRHFGNGIHISAQKSFETFFNASRSECETNLNNESDKTVSRVLNELSPTRDGLESNNLLLKKLADCDRISDRVRTRSSRESTPDSLHSSDISNVSVQRSDRSGRRSASRTSVGKDVANLVDVENICDNDVTRKTRSMDKDEKKFKERSQSPASLLKKNTHRIIS